jgi:N-acetylglutamate synthase-like GNAT family acetyltransferase
MTQGATGLLSDCRLAVASDAEKLVQLIKASYRGDISRRGWASEADLVEGDRISIDQVLALIERDNSFILVLDRGGEIIACCHVEDHGEGCAYFGTFAVFPPLQGAGLGDYLLTKAECQSIATFGSMRMELNVLGQQARLVEWYERRGFRRTGEIREFPADEKFARPLRRGLYFTVLRKEFELRRDGDLYDQSAGCAQ